MGEKALILYQISVHLYIQTIMVLRVYIPLLHLSTKWFVKKKSLNRRMGGELFAVFNKIDIYFLLLWIDVIVIKQSNHHITLIFLSNNQLSTYFSFLGPNFSLVTSAKLSSHFSLLEVHSKSIISTYFKENNYNSIAVIS